MKCGGIKYEKFPYLKLFYLEGKTTSKIIKRSFKNIGKKQFAVTSYYNGTKNIDEIITRIAVSKTYNDIENGLIYRNNKTNSVNDLAKPEAI